MKSIEEMVNEIKKTVVITGGAGSLGKAFCRMLHKTHNVIVIDNSEWAVADLQKELPDVECYLMDFADWSFSEMPCDYLLHLAAFKHVNLGEVSHWAFLENNVVKTEILFREAANAGVDVLFVSTDKAVEPISFYGYTKAIGEDLAEGHGFAVARLGNIINSSGSVIPTWESCIENGLPIPVTDERMTRYVIEDFDAVNQIWDMFKSGKRLIIPQCSEHRILDILTQVLSKHGKTISDVTIEKIGLRPGEKLKEELRWEDEK